MSDFDQFTLPSDRLRIALQHSQMQRRHLEDVNHESANNSTYAEDILQDLEQRDCNGNLDWIASMKYDDFIPELSNKILILAPESVLHSIAFNDDEAPDTEFGSTIAPALGLHEQHVLETESGDNPIFILSKSAESAREFMHPLFSMMARSLGAAQCIKVQGPVSDVRRNGFPRFVLQPQDIKSAGIINHLYLHKLELSAPQLTSILLCCSRVTFEVCQFEENAGENFLDGLKNALSEHRSTRVEFKECFPLNETDLVQLTRWCAAQASDDGPTVAFTEGVWRLMAGMAAFRATLVDEVAAAFESGDTLPGLAFEYYGGMSSEEQENFMQAIILPGMQICLERRPRKKMSILSNLQAGIVPVAMHAKSDLTEKQQKFARRIILHAEAKKLIEGGDPNRPFAPCSPVARASGHQGVAGLRGSSGSNDNHSDSAPAFGSRRHDTSHGKNATTDSQALQVRAETVDSPEDDADSDPPSPVHSVPGTISTGSIGGDGALVNQSLTGERRVGGIRIMGDNHGATFTGGVFKIAPGASLINMAKTNEHDNREVLEKLEEVQQSSLKDSAAGKREVLDKLDDMKQANSKESAACNREVLDKLDDVKQSNSKGVAGLKESGDRNHKELKQEIANSAQKAAGPVRFRQEMATPTAIAADRFGDSASAGKKKRLGPLSNTSAKKPRSSGRPSKNPVQKRPAAPSIPNGASATTTADSTSLKFRTRSGKKKLKSTEHD